MLLVWQWVFLVGWMQTCFACETDTRCLNNRACTFGSQTAYNKVAAHLYQITGCGNCALDCTTACDCLAVSSVLDLIQNASFCDNYICDQPLTQHALQYVTYNFPCETAFGYAQQQLIRLCGTINGVCCEGKCTQHWEINQPEPRCETHQVHAAVRWLLSAYVIVVVVLWQWASITSHPAPSS